MNFYDIPDSGNASFIPFLILVLISFHNIDNGTIDPSYHDQLVVM